LQLLPKLAEHQVGAAGKHTWSLLCLVAGTCICLAAGTCICAAHAEVFEAEVLEALLQSPSAGVLAATSKDLWHC